MSKIVRGYFEGSISAVDIDNWPCPYCGTGNLKLIFSEKNESSEAKEYNYVIGDDFRIEFVKVFKCAKCVNMFAINGVEIETPVSCPDTGEEDSIVECIISSHSCSFLPIDVSDEWPCKVVDEIKNSGKYLFSDHSACINSLRKAVELLMCEHGIPSTKPNKDGQEVFISLDKRIAEFEKCVISTDKLLSSVKWLGNTGSHASGRLSKDSILHAYDSLKRVLDSLYVDIHLYKNADRIDKQKGRLL